MMGRSDDGVACVLGASGGIGAALVRALCDRGGGPVHAGGRSPPPLPAGATGFAFDFADEASIARAAQAIAQSGTPRLVVVATGALTFPDGTGPERSIRSLDPERMAAMFALNTIGPALVAKHLLPLLPREGRSVFAVLSARVGSIGDNRLGGWHSYRASKAALNMLVRNFAIELSRTRPEAIAVALHPGTVATPLSEPFQRNLPSGQLLTPDASAAHLLEVIDGLTPADSGTLRAWDGETIPF